MRFEWRDFSIKILSLFMALLLWVYVTNEQNPLDTRTFNVSLSARGLPAQISVDGLPAAVSVQVQGTRGQLVGIDAGDFQASVDLSGVTAGDDTVDVAVNIPPGLRLLRVSPDRVRVLVDRIIEKRIPVVVSLDGTPAPGYNALEPKVDPGTVLAGGPARLVQPLARAVAEVNIQAASGPVTRVVTLSGIPAGVNISSRVAKVEVPVTPLPTKTVAVKPQITGDPAPGYQVRDVTVQPDNVQVSAPGNVLDGIQSVKTGALDISGAQQDVTQTVNLQAPAGAAGLRPDRVEVTVHLQAVNQEPGQTGGKQPSSGGQTPSPPLSPSPSGQ
ncbi:CdaR family protein [Desulfotomaculum copahuensis]|uniref:YbbR domain pair protein n=1 Tax=Desulfotomaculum copahuensis TaxID=1838280 RepID=A0A1B7LFM9_9FIRM|nr:CdaR family protein [Desulfotomaculum copahuensis]OAT82363.1 hypothetical protein A6M21_09480 [Desulfotomaculum copahuensis]